MFRNKKYDQILDILQELLARTQENKNGIARIERKVEEIRKPKAKEKSHIKEVKEIKKEVKEVKPKRKKLNFERTTNVEHIAINPKAKTRDFPIEYNFKNKDDMTIAEFAKVLGVGHAVLRNRIYRLEQDPGIKWTDNDNFIYYIREKGQNNLTKVLTKPAQDQLIRRYGYGKKPSGRKPKNYIA